MDEDGYATIVDRKKDMIVTAAYKVPRAVQFVERVPMTASGKIMRRMLATIDDVAEHAHPDMANSRTPFRQMA